MAQDGGIPTSTSSTTESTSAVLLNQVMGKLLASMQAAFAALEAVTAAVVASIIGGSTGSVDNAVLRAKGTAGRALENSLLLVGDTGILSEAGTGGVPIVGTSTNGNAAAGQVGEILETNTAAGSAVSLTTNTTANVATRSLTAGDWQVWGNVWFDPAATTSVTIFSGAISQTTATLPTAPNGGAYFTRRQAAAVPADDFGEPVGAMRISLAATTDVYLVARATFTVDTLSAYGYIAARRMR